MRLHHVQRGGGEPLLLVHGIGDSQRAWTRVLDRLAESHQCLAIDLPGFGASPPLDGTPSVAALAAAARDFMRERGHERFHVAGNSLGGAIALELARSGSARSACALSPAGFAEGWERAWLAASLRTTRAVSGLVARGPAVTRSRLARRALAAQMVADGARYGAGELAATTADLAAAPGFHATMGPLVAHREPPGEAGCPVTVAWGDRDRLLLYRPQAARARERLPAARHVTLPGCGHIPMWDDPALVARTILETAAAA